MTGQLYMGADLRDVAMGPPRVGPVVVTFPAPKLAGGGWAQSPGVPGPRVSGWAGKPGGWASPPGPVAASSSSTVQHVGAEWGLPSMPQLPAAPSLPSLPTMEGIQDWWAGLASQLHRGAVGGGVGLITGIRVPEEARTPSAAREYLAELLESQGKLRNWPPQSVAAHASAIRSTALAGTVQATIDRIMATAAPPPTWPGVQGWYTVAKQIQTSAAMLSLGELTGKWQTVPRSMLEAAKAEGFDIRRGYEIAERISKGAAIGIPLGMIAAGLAVGVTALVVFGGGTAAFFAPEIATTAAAGKKIARTGAARAKKAAERF